MRPSAKHFGGRRSRGGGTDTHDDRHQKARQSKSDKYKNQYILTKSSVININMKEFQVWFIPSSGLNRAPPCTAAKERNRSSNGGHRPQAGDEDGADKSRGTRSGRRSRTPPHGVYKSVVRGELRKKTKRSWLVIPPRTEFIKCNNSAKSVIKSSSPIVRVPKSRRIEVGSKKYIPGV